MADSNADLKKQLEALQQERDQLLADKKQREADLQMAKTSEQKLAEAQKELEKAQAELAKAREQSAELSPDQLFPKVKTVHSYLCEPQGNCPIKARVIRNVPDASEAKRQFLVSTGSRSSKYTVKVTEVAADFELS
ncbi:hypothetical protein [Rubinisphaera brasiliensis]|uniref:Uncharacterized protein n=1 Tax=Rubinisphaera brasiliensis (strain ATCC 49424 / DSM 5305 / JCM 21570 / IAM 15109 / NBRC 103401 / IFAM 1448) TaxID=756272 RepID=F0SNL9_RUBBR|nr:hypothetical protein [Rubinisphaera brasiliensis]ADY57853.1 hypothetical protein Plabr_0224 [Rubinisphaera brasiliensis DSM 5305]